MEEKSRYSVSVVIPAYNEELYIQKTILCLEKELKNICDDFEIIIVNDASSDGTAGIVKNLQKTRPYVSMITNEKNVGLGGSLRMGFAGASKEIVFYSDADLPFDFFELKRALRIMDMKDADMILGFRLDRTDEGIVRIVYSLVYNILLRILFGISVKDINFSFKLMRKNVLDKMRLESEGSFIDAEIIIKAHKMGLFFCQMGIDYLKRKYGESTLSSPRVIMKIFRELYKQYPSLIRFSSK